MPSPFPGMNPYLEGSEMWREFHHWLLILLAEALGSQLRPKYRVAVGQRVYQYPSMETVLIGIPDVIATRSQSAVANGNVTESVVIKNTTTAVVAPPVKPLTVGLPMLEEAREIYLEVRQVPTKKVVALIELLSPKNKRAGMGRKIYMKKRLKILESDTHLIEIDLLRGGKHMPIVNTSVSSHYRVLVSRSERRPLADLYAFNLPDPIPPFPLPLQPGDTEPIIDLQHLLHDVYDRAGLDLAIDYHNQSALSLSPEETTWINQCLEGAC
jgi:hypothetical protein